MRRDPQENAQVLYQIAASQGGYFTAAQARVAGYTYRQQHYHSSRGNWLRIDRGISRVRNYLRATRINRDHNRPASLASWPPTGRSFRLDCQIEESVYGLLWSVNPSFSSAESSA